MDQSPRPQIVHFVQSGVEAHGEDICVGSLVQFAYSGLTVGPKRGGDIK